MGSKRKNMEDEMSRFEAEISSSSNTTTSSTNLFVPSQISRTVIGSNTYSQIQQKLAQHPNVPPPPVPPFQFIPPPQMLMSQSQLPEKSYSTEPSPIILSSAPKLYASRPTVGTHPSTTTPTVNSFELQAMQYEVQNKLKKLKSAEKSNSSSSAPGPNPIAEDIIKAARASSALQSFGNSDKKNKKDRKNIRVGGGQVWEDHSLADWTDDDFRIFCGDLGNDVNDELLTRTFSKYPSFQKAKVVRDKRTSKSKGYGFISFKDPQDFIRAMKEMDGRYVGSRPIKLRKSTWKSRSFDVVKKKEKEKQALLSLFNKS